ncbi:MAG: efflux RND transporter permease subunit [Chthoniobacterales bacterium]
MFDRLIAFSVRNRLLVVVVAALIAAYGGYVLTRIPVDVFPDLNRPTVTVFTEAGGLAPDEVELLVTVPIETAVNGAAGVERVRSLSGIGLSLVFVEFGWDTDIYRARQIVGEKVAEVAPSLPREVSPFLGPVSSIMGQIMAIGLTSESADIGPTQLRTLADWDVRRRLMSIPGVSQVTVMGGDVRQYQVLVDPALLVANGVTLHDVQTAIDESNVNSSGGFLPDAHTEMLIRNLARVETADDLAATVVKVLPDGSRVLLGQVAEVREGAALNKRGDAGIDGQPGVILTVQKQPGADTVSLTRRIEAELDVMAAALPEGVRVHDDIFRQSNFIERAIHNVEEALRDGSLMVAVVLFVFLLNFRTTAITLTAIPLSLLITFIAFKMAGLGINTMTLGGLAVAIGELVDDAIVDVENVFRRLRENRHAAHPRPVLDVVVSASREIRNSIVYATMLVVLVFLPLFALQGIEGRIFTPLAVAYIVSILASLAVSLTVTPALCALLLPRMKRMEHRSDGWLVRRIKALEARVLDFGFAAPKKVYLAAGALLAAALVILPTLGREFLPEFNEGSITAFVVSAPGTSLEESNRISRIAEELLAGVPEARTIARRTGRAEGDEHVLEVNTTEIEFELEPSERSKPEILADIRERLGTLPGVGVSVGQPISHRIDHILSGVQAQIAIKVFGDDLDELRRLAGEVRDAVSGVPGLADVQIERVTLVPQVHVRFDRAKCAAYGLRPGEAARYTSLALKGAAVTEVLEGQRSFDVVLRLTDEARQDLDAIRSIPIDTLGGEVVPLGLVADVSEAMGPNMINRENAQRRIYVSANAAGRDLVGVVREAQAAVAEKVVFPEGYFVTYGGQFESEAGASRLILILGTLSLLAMLFVLYMQFQSMAFAAQVMLNIPLAFVGAIFGVKFFAGGVLSVASLVGFIALTGIAARNGIMMITHYLHLMREEGMKFDRAMIVRGTQERIVPVLMTALTAGLALLPLLFGAGQPGKEILHPVAVVIFCGLFTSTLLDLILRPLVFWQYGRRAAQRLVPQAFSNETTTPTNDTTS